MSYIDITYPGWIDDKELWASLTGSTTLLKSSKDVLWGVSVVVDFWMHQGSKNADELNKKISKEIINADFLVITHAHMDHIWRIPQLIKEWFKWKILMTKATRDIAILMWEDYIKLTQRQIEELEAWNKKKWEKFREYLKIVNLYESLQNNNLNKKDKEKKQQSLNNIVWNNDIEKKYLKTKNILEENNIKSVDDIDNILNSNIPELLYDISDVYNTLKLIETMEVLEEKSLDSRIVITKADSDVIERLPELIEEWYDKKIFVLPALKQVVVNKLWEDYKNTNELNIKNKQIKEEYQSARKFVREYEQLKNKKKINKNWNIDEQIIKSKEKLEKNEIFVLRKKLKSLLEIKNKLENFENKFKIIEWKTLEDNENELKKIKNNIKKKRETKIEWFSLQEWLEFYRKIEGYINTKNWKQKNNLDTFYFDFNFFSKNSKIIDFLLKDDNKNLNLFLEIQEEIKNLETKRRKIINEKDLIIEREKFLNNKEKLLEEIKELEQYWIEKVQDIEEYIKQNFWKKKLKYTKEQIEKTIKRLELISEEENKKVVESLKLRFYNAGHVVWSIMASLSFVTKEVKSKVNWILQSNWNSFNWLKEIKKSHKNFLFTWDLWKITQANLSGSPDIPELKYDYVQMESTYANKDHPDKIKEFERLIEILNRPWKKLIAAFSFQRTQEVLTELLNNKANNLSNIEKIKKLQNRRNKIRKNYNSLLKKEKLNIEEEKQKQDLFLEITSIENKIKQLSKWIFSWFIIQDSPLASKITNVFLNHFPEIHKILDPLFQKQIFWKQQIRELENWEYKKIYSEIRKMDNDIIIASGWMMQWWAIINHIKQLVSDPRATIILTWYVAEWTLWRKLLDIEKQLLSASKLKREVIIDWEVYEVKCKVESIWGYSSHMWQSDLVSFWWELLNYAKQAKLSLTHWDENRKILKNLIEKVNSKVDIIIPKLGDKQRIKL